MWRVLLYIALFGVAAYGAIWLADHPETVALTWGGREYSTSLAVGVVAIVGLAILISLVWSVVQFLLRLPARVGRGSREKRREKGYRALSRGIIAVGAGDLSAARRHAGDAERLIGHEPLTLLLKAQAAQAAGDRDGAEAAFRRMADSSETRVLGLRGLFLEAKRRDDPAAARAHAEEAARLAPSAAWANDAVLDAYSAEGDWQGAIGMVERRASLGLVDRGTSRRQRAVLHAADALAKEERDPEGALAAALEANRLAPDLVPSAALAGRLLSRRGDLRKAAKVIEAAWRETQHPDLAAAYLNLRTGDSAADRLRRAETLARLSSWSPEARLAMARAAIEARELARARDVLRPLLDERPTTRACLAMAELEQADGAPGRVREWLARATRAPRDKAWIADGIVSESWGPLSPVSGRLDALRWDTPPELLGGRATFDDVFTMGEPDQTPEPPPLALPVSGSQTSAAAMPADPPSPVLEPSAEASSAPSPVETAPAEPEPVAPAVPVAAATEPRRPSPVSAGYVPRDPAPVVFPVPHAPDDPGAEADERRSRVRVLG